MTGIHEKAQEDSHFLHSGSPLSFALVQNISPPGQSLTCQQGNCQGKDNPALLLAALLPFIIISRKGFLLPVDGIRSSKASRCWGSGAFSLPTLDLLQHKPPTATGSHQEGEEADPASIISYPISEISQQQPLHRFHSKSFTPTLKSGH